MTNRKINNAIQEPKKAIDLAGSKKIRMYILLSILFFTGAILQIWVVPIYRKSIIDLIIPTSIWLVSGIICTLLTSKILDRYYDKLNIFFKLVFNTIAFGGIITFSFIALNYYLGDANEEDLKVAIIRTGELAKSKKSCGNSYAVVNINAIEKELIFPCNFDLKPYRYIEVKLKKGFLGYYIITGNTPALRH